MRVFELPIYFRAYSILSQREIYEWQFPRFAHHNLSFRHAMKNPSDQKRVANRFAHYNSLIVFREYMVLYGFRIGNKDYTL